MSKPAFRGLRVTSDGSRPLLNTRTEPEKWWDRGATITREHHDAAERAAERERRQKRSDALRRNATESVDRLIRSQSATTREPWANAVRSR